MRSFAVLLVFALLAICILNLSCSGGKTADDTSANEEKETAEESSSDNTPSVCIWDQVAVRDSPSDKGKYLTAISIGETLEVFTDTTGNGKLFIKVKLIDGTEGYARKDFIISGGKASVFIIDADTYSRPDALTKTDKKFSKYDIVAIANAQSEFLEVKGKRAGGKWIETAWVRSGNLSDDKLNIAAAKFISKALAEKDKNIRAKALQGILDNRDLSGASFYNEIQGMIDDLTIVPGDTTGI